MFIEELRTETPPPSVIGSPQWTMNVSADFLRLGATRYHAELLLWDEPICRISLKQPVSSRAEAVRLLTERCRTWIARHEDRPRRGDTDFQVLPG
jgi:hypothetical protein